jgi:hypothetical protein
MSRRGIGHDEFAAAEGNKILLAFSGPTVSSKICFSCPSNGRPCEPDDFDDIAGKNPASARVFGVNSGHRTVTGLTADG